MNDPGAGSIRVAFAGDTILGGGVAALASPSGSSLFAPEVEEVAREADLILLNLECCISARGEPWPDKVPHFRAPPAAVEVLARLGVDCVTLANNHSLDFGSEALLDTFDHLASAGIGWVGAGPDLERARRPVVLERRGFRLAVVAVTNHPQSFAAHTDRPGVAFVDLETPDLGWLTRTLDAAKSGADAVLLSPHWGPNWTARPTDQVRAAAAALRGHATLIVGHSAHVFHGVRDNVLFDLGDFLHYWGRDPFPPKSPLRRIGHLLGELRQIPAEALRCVSAAAGWAGEESFRDRQRRRLERLLRRTRARRLRPDLGLLFLMELDARGPRRLEAVPLRIGPEGTRLAMPGEAAWIGRRFGVACRALGTAVTEERGRSVIVW